MKTMETLTSLIRLMRIPEWTKSLMNMSIAAIIAVYAANIEFSFPIFFYGFFSLALLWSGLYTLNDFTDRNQDAKHPVKRNRPIPSGKIPPSLALLFSLTLIAISLYMGFTINPIFLTCLVIMLANQLLYTVKPIQLKTKPVFDLISGSLINPLFRFYCGWALFVPAFNAPLLPILFILGMQFGGYPLYRISSTKQEKEFGYKTSAILFGVRKIQILCYLSLTIGAIAFFALTLNSLFMPELNHLGFLPIKFILLPLVALFFIPLYAKVLKHPEEMDLKGIYKQLYFHTLLFTIVLFAIFYLPL